jgi:hypothetical protein
VSVQLGYGQKKGGPGGTAIPGEEKMGLLRFRGRFGYCPINIKIVIVWLGKEKG